jgi:diguanylate cyclase (GGDEF)-like protein
MAQAMGRVPKDVSQIDGQRTPDEAEAMAGTKGAAKDEPKIGAIASFRKWLPGLNLVGKFAVMSIIPMALLGAILGQTLSSRIHERILENNKHAAELIGRLGIQPLLRPSDLGRGLDPNRFRILDNTLRAGLIGEEVARIKIWNRDSRVIYSDDSEIVGRTFRPSAGLSAALQGEVSGHVEGDLDEAEAAGERHLGRLLEVYVPLQFGDYQRPAGAFEIYLPYEPIATVIQRETNRMYLLLLGGLVLLYAVLFRIVKKASQRLRRQAAENEHLALYDGLTDLPNRTLFHDRIEQAILAAERESYALGVLIIDVDRFKEVNDTLGHRSGDLLLQQIGTRIQATVRESDTVARLGGDEFGVLLPKLVDRRSATGVAEKVRKELERSFMVKGLVLDVEASMGIALYPEHGADAETLIQHADVAMYAAKEEHSHFEFYAAKHDQYSPSRLALLGELRRGLQEGELVLHYQPKADVQSAEIKGVEALVRWQHPTRNLLMPMEFVPLAEHTGLMRPFTLYVLDEALRQCDAWRQTGLRMRMAVNLSVRNLQDEQFPEDVARLLGKWGIPAKWLELEITESAFMTDPTRAMAILDRLSFMGVRLSLDDFGTGHSSLSYLQRLPVNEVKIDRSFVMNMATDENDATIVRATIELGRNLGLETVAEGVETPQIWNQLMALGCDMAQGYYLTRPVPAAELWAWMEARPAQILPVQGLSTEPAR